MQYPLYIRNGCGLLLEHDGQLLLNFADDVSLERRQTLVAAGQLRYTYPGKPC